MTEVFLFKERGAERLPLSASPLGFGGQAKVYAVSNDPGRVVKIYHRPNDQRTKRLHHMMLAYRPEEFVIDASGHPVLVWPSAIVYDADGRAVGYVMRRVGPPAEMPLFTLFSPGARLTAFPEASWRFLVGVARNLSALVAELHHHPQDIVVGDLSHNNIMVSREGFVTLLDCDSVQFRHDSEFFPCETSTLDYAAPELQLPGDTPRSVSTDNFTLAVLLCRLLTAGDHPFLGIPVGHGIDEPSPSENIRRGLSHIVRPDEVHVPSMAVDLDVLPPKIIALARRAFGPGHADAAQRPGAEEWHGALQSEWEHTRTCDRRPRHSYGQHLSSCPWCARVTDGQRDPFNPPETRPRAPVRTPIGRLTPVPDLSRPASPPTPAPVGKTTKTPDETKMRTKTKVLVVAAIIVLLVIIIIAAVASRGAI